MGGDVANQDLVDPFGRVIRDLRISVTDRCNFRCTYCMPLGSMKGRFSFLPLEKLLIEAKADLGL